VLSGGIARFCAIEDKATTGLSEAQRKYKARVESLGGLFFEARSVSDVRAAFVAEFGEDAVTKLERSIAARRGRVGEGS
jgi:hypothetical protein